MLSLKSTANTPRQGASGEFKQQQIFVWHKKHTLKNLKIEPETLYSHVCNDVIYI